MLADSYDVYLVCHPFAKHVTSYRSLLHGLGDLDGHHLAGAEGFYRPDLDTALIVLRFTLRAHRRLGDGLIEMLSGRAGLPMVIPDRLDPTTRRNFFLDHVSRYTTYVQLYPGPDPLPLAERVAVRLAEHASGGGESTFDTMQLPVIDRAGPPGRAVRRYRSTIG
jgi:hypothetical protein